MANLTAPIFTGTLNSKPLRFFRAPYDDPHLPWHCFGDLLLCCGIDPCLSTELARIIRADHPEAVKSAAMTSGICISAAHYVAKGMIEQMVDARRMPFNSIMAYQVLIIEAWESAHGRACTDRFLLAFNNTNNACEQGGIA